MFNFGPNFNTLIRRALPHFLRKPNTLALLSAAGTVLQDLNTSFLAFRDALDTKLRLTAQVIYLEKYLNDLYDPILRRIFIDNTSTINYLYVRNKAELLPPQFFLRNNSEATGTPVFIKNNGEIQVLDDFIINIPVSVTFVEDVVRSQVNVYNLAGKQYSILTF